MAESQSSLFSFCANLQESFGNSLPPEQPDILVYIPARSGSKGLPGKNIALLGGRPLISYAILPALKLRGRVRVMVDTDAPDIAEVACAFGAEVPFLREAELASDDASPGTAQSRFLQRLYETSGYTPQIIMTLFVTSPFRTTTLLEKILAVLLEGRASNAITVLKAPVRLDQMFVFLPSGIRPLAALAPQQSFYTLYLPCPLAMARWHWSEQPDYILEFTDVDYSVDIDTSEDMVHAQNLLVRRGWTEHGWDGKEEKNNQNVESDDIPIELRGSVLPRRSLWTVGQALRGSLSGKELLFRNGQPWSITPANAPGLRRLREMAKGKLPVCGTCLLEKEHPARLRTASEILLEDILVPAARMCEGGSRISPLIRFQWPPRSNTLTWCKPVAWLDGFNPLPLNDVNEPVVWERLDAETARIYWHTFPWPLSGVADENFLNASLYLSAGLGPSAFIYGTDPILQTNIPADVPGSTLHLECANLHRMGDWFISQGCWACAVQAAESAVPLYLRITREANALESFSLWRPPSIPALWMNNSDGTMLNSITQTLITGRQHLPPVWRIDDSLLYLPEGWTLETVLAINRGSFVPFKSGVDVLSVDKDNIYV